MPGEGDIGRTDVLLYQGDTEGLWLSPARGKAGIKTPRGGAWTAMQVKRTLDRVG